MLALLRGDSTDFMDMHTITLKIGDLPYSTAKCTADFTLCGQRVTIDTIEPNTDIPIVFTDEQTAQMPIGVQCGVFRILDPSGRVRTIDATIRIMVTDNPSEVYGTSQFVSVSGTISWSYLADLPLQGVTYDLSDYNGIIAALGAVLEALGGTPHA